ncbi:MAG: hypothetical protein QOE86_2677 [Solirubrobacteraceae bacterium]|nr:hypothetical protein [Solirubrobacteraceae bacterium]
MTRARLAVLAVLSAFATAAVLAHAGAGPRPALAAALLQRAALVRPPAPAPVAVATAAPVPVADARAAGPSAPAPVVPAAPAPVVPPTPAEAAAPPTPTPTPTPTPAPAKPSRIGHVFVIALTGPGYQATFGPGSPATYLTGQLRPAGALLSAFAPVDGADLPNYLAFAGGQPPNAATRSECATYADFPSDAAPGKDGVLAGDGCIYPNTVLSIGDQISSSGGQWRAYAEDLGAGPAAAASCRHPVVGGADDTLTDRPGDGYATRHNPFVYFHSLLDLSDCQADDLPLDRLTTDLGSANTTPRLAFIAPDLCDSGSAIPCADGRPGGLATADAFLAKWVPAILASAAYKRDGLLIVSFLSGPAPNPGPARPAPTGTLLLSRFAQPGSLYAKSYDPYSLLRSIEDLLALKPLAKAAGADSFARVALRAAFAGG